MSVLFPLQRKKNQVSPLLFLHKDILVKNVDELFALLVEADDDKYEEIFLFKQLMAVQNVNNGLDIECCSIIIVILLRGSFMYSCTVGFTVTYMLIGVSAFSPTINNLFFPQSL